MLRKGRLTRRPISTTARSGAAHTEDFRDIANAVSLLWRLRQRKRAEVGRRWDELGEMRGDAPKTRRPSLARCMDCWFGRATSVRRRESAPIWRNGRKATGISHRSPASSALPIAAQLAGDDACRNAGQVVNRLRRYGSRAQRDIFLRALAAECSDTNEALAILNARGKT